MTDLQNILASCTLLAHLTLVFMNLPAELTKACIMNEGYPF